MEEFVNTIAPQKYAATNGTWNDLQLNNPWSVGYVTTLIELQQFTSKEKWEEFYYKSGEMRNKKLKMLSPEEQTIAENYTLVRRGPGSINKLSWEIKNINYQMGRTKEQLDAKGRELYHHMQKKGIDITCEECCECVRFRVICETWNGIVCREHNTIQKLQNIFPQINYVKVAGEIDYGYAIDYELYLNDQLKCAIQIKPESYFKGKAPYLISARMANEQKNTRYTAEKHVPVYNIVSQSSGDIINYEILTEIQQQL